MAEALTVACGQGAVRLAGLRRMDGSFPEITALAKPGDRLAPVAPEEVQALTGFAEALAPAEPFWRRAFAGFTPATLAGGGQGASGTEEIAFDWPEALDLQQKADLVRHWAAQASGMPDAGIALVHAGLETRGGLALPWVPFQRGDDIARLQTRPAVPADLALRSPEIPALRLPDVAFALDVPSEAPLTVTAAGRLVFDRARISPAMGRILADRLAAMAEARIQGAALPDMPPAERDLVLYGWNRTQADHDRSLTMQTAFEAQVARTPEATALVVGREEMSYAALNARANRVAHVLRGMGVGPGTLVGLCTARNIHLVVGALAILKGRRRLCADGPHLSRRPARALPRRQRRAGCADGTGAEGPTARERRPCAHPGRRSGDRDRAFGRPRAAGQPRGSRLSDLYLRLHRPAKGCHGGTSQCGELLCRHGYPDRPRDAGHMAGADLAQLRHLGAGIVLFAGARLQAGAGQRGTEARDHPAGRGHGLQPLLLGQRRWRRPRQISLAS